MTSRMRRRARGLLFAIVSVALVGAVTAGPALADNHESDGGSDASFAMPGWLSLVSPHGKYVLRNGSRSKFLEDYNLQSGVDNHLHIDHSANGRDFSLRGFGQSGEKQGFLTTEYGELGSFDLMLDLQAWTEYYNVRTGEDRPNVFPFSNSGRLAFGSGIPSTDWFTVGGSAGVQTDSVFSDVYLDFHYRDVNGDQTLVKSGSVDGLFVDGSGPGTVAFDYPSRKKVDYDSYMSFMGGRSGLGGINWQTDVSYEFHNLHSKTTAPHFDAATVIDEVDRFDEDSQVHLVKYDLAGGRALSSDMYVYGTGFFSYERSDPDPDQFVATPLGTFQTRETTGSKVNRYTPAASFGTVYQLASDAVLSANTSLRGHISNADLDETRNESAFLVGDVGDVSNDVDRYAVVSTTEMNANWRVAPRVTIEGNARYQYRWDDVDSRQDMNFVQTEPSEIEKYETDNHRLKVGPSIRYKMRKGRKVEAGYEFSYTDVEQDVDKLSNQFILGDYDALRHRAYVKASGRMMKKLRGELRAQYVYEERDMDAPRVQPQIVGNASSGKVNSHIWNVTPSLYYLPSKDWSLYGTYSIGYVKIEPNSGSSFEYKTLTQSGSMGVTYRASEKWSASGAYTVYYNDDSVENIGHNASLTGAYDIDENWEIHGGYRYLMFDMDDTSMDDYDTSIISLGVTGRF